MPGRATPDLPLFGLIALATYRTSRLLVTDAITRPLRERFFNRWPPNEDRAAKRWNGERLVDRAADAHLPQPSWIGRLVGCAWCVSVWTASIITLLTSLYVSVPLPLLTIAAAATAAGFLGAIDRALE